MPHIVLNEEQAQVLMCSTEPIEIHDERGNVLRILKPMFTKEDIEAALASLRSNQPRYQLSDILRRLEVMIPAGSMGESEGE